MITTNILIIGQSGVGKSSLLNYLFGAELEETGGGKPITKRGIYPHTYRVNPDFGAVIYDTWGVEADHAAEWEQLILDEVKNHDSVNIAEWFHTVFFCVSAARARIEDFELQIVRRIWKSGCHVMGVITNAGNPGAQNTVVAMRKTLEGAGFKTADIIPVSSVEKKTFAGTVNRFGKEELLAGIRDNLWETICAKLPHLLKDTAAKSLDEAEKDMLDLADRHFTFWNYNLRDRYEKFSDICNQRMDHCRESIGQAWRDILDSAVVYYRQLMTAYHIRVTMQIPQVMSDIRFEFHLSGMQQIKNLLQGNLLGNLIPGGMIFANVAKAKKKREEIKGQIRECFAYARQETEYKAMQCGLFKSV